MCAEHSRCVCVKMVQLMGNQNICTYVRDVFLSDGTVDCLMTKDFVREYKYQSAEKELRCHKLLYDDISWDGKHFLYMKY